MELNSKNSRSAKECEYVNCVCVWLETGFTALILFMEGGGKVEESERKLEVTDKALKDALECLSIRAQYCRDITDH